MFTELLMTVVLMADIVSPRVQEAIVIKETEPTIQIVEKTEWVPPQTAPKWQDGFAHYRVNGVEPPYEWQWYLYGQLDSRGIAWYYPYAVCQIYQESNWNQWSDNGQDRGLCQQKAVYWDSRAAQAGIAGADIWNPYAQLYVYAWQMANYLSASGYSVEGALSIYYLGYAGYSAEYVGHVMRWMDYLEVVK